MGDVLDAAAIRASLEASLCPWCGAGPFKSPANHIYPAHGYSADEVRELAGLAHTAVLTTPELHERLVEQKREMLQDSVKGEAMRAALEAGRAPEVQRQRANPWEREATREKLVATRRRPEVVARFRERMAQVDKSVAARSRSPEAVAAQTERVKAGGQAWRERLGPEGVSAVYREVALRTPEEIRRERMAKVNAAAVEALMRPDEFYSERVRLYLEEVERRGRTYGAAAAVARRLGIDSSTLLNQLAVAEQRGLLVKPPRASEVVRTCSVCGTEFTQTRSENIRKTCSKACEKEGRAAKTAASRRPPREATCIICGTLFTYSRPGTKPRTLCDNPACRTEVSRRCAERRRGADGKLY